MVPRTSVSGASFGATDARFLSFLAESSGSFIGVPVAAEEGKMENAAKIAAMSREDLDRFVRDVSAVLIPSKGRLSRRSFEA